MAFEAVTVSANDHEEDMTRAGGPDRFHNQNRQSPESLAQTVQELEAAVRTLEERMATLNVDLVDHITTVEQRGDQATRRLGLDVVEMGEALSRRIRTTPAGIVAPIATASPRRGARINRVVFGLSGALIAALSVLGWALLRHPAAVIAAKAPAQTAAVLYAPPPPTPSVLAAAAPPAHVRAPPSHHAYGKSPLQHWTRPKATSAARPGSYAHTAASPAPARAEFKGAAPTPP